MNANMESRAQGLYDSAQSAYNEATAGGVEFAKFTLDGKMFVYRNDGVVLSMSVRLMEYTGGAHPNPDSLFSNVLNSSPGKKLAIADLFTDSSGVALVKKKINTIIAKTPADYFVSAVSIDSKSWFYLTATKLVIVFPHGSIGPESMGEPEFELPISAFAGKLISALS